MTFINFIPDDLGVQRLKAENAKPGSANAVTAVDPYPAEEAGQPHPRPPLRRRQAHEQRAGERRRGDRRRKQEPVLLDTRSHHERRRQPDRREENGAEPAAPSIDLFA